MTVSDAVVGVRVPIVARLGTSVWARFHVDVVADGIQMTGAPDPVPTLTGMDFAGLVRHEYLAYPSVDHIADKACAILERYGPLARPSTRYKDLIDLSCLVMHESPAATSQRRALVSEAARRGIALPPRFAVPDVELWRLGYAAEARRTVVPVPRSLADALDVVAPYLDPLLDGSARGVWSPGSRSWSPLDVPASED